MSCAYYYMEKTTSHLYIELIIKIIIMQDWTKKGGWRVLKTKPMVLPGQEGFPYRSERTKDADYASRNFKNSPI